MLPDLLFLACRFVDVVAEVRDQVEVFLGHVLVRGEVATLEVLARSEGEPQAIRQFISAWCRARPPFRTDLTGRAELVEVPASRLKARDLDMDRVREFSRCDGRSLCNDLRHRFIVGNLPIDDDVFWRHPAPFERFWREARPQHKAIRCRITRRDAERERIARQLHALLSNRRTRSREQRPRSGSGSTSQEELAARPSATGQMQTWQGHGFGFQSGGAIHSTTTATLEGAVGNQQPHGSVLVNCSSLTHEAFTVRESLAHSTTGGIDLP